MLQYHSSLQESDKMPIIDKILDRLGSSRTSLKHPRTVLSKSFRCKAVSAMNALASSSPVESEILIKRRWKWWRSLWVRILAIVALMWIITGLFLWSHCRSAWAVFRVNGLAETSQNSPLQSLRRSSGLGHYVSEFFIQDRDVVTVLLFNTAVNDQWLVRLRRFPRLANAALDGGQIGPGLQNLADLPDLKMISVSGSQMTIIRNWIDHIDSTISGRHFLLIPQLESLALSGFKGTISDLDQLDQHPHLHSLSLNSISQLSQVLKQIENCQNIKSLSIHQQEAFDEDAFQSLCRMPHLQTLTISNRNKMDVVDSQLKQSLKSTTIVWRP